MNKLEKAGKLLREARQNAELTQIELAQACGWRSQSQISQFESGTRQMTVGDLHYIGVALGKDVEEQLTNILKGTQGFKRKPRNRGILEQDMSKQLASDKTLHAVILAMVKCSHNTKELPPDDVIINTFQSTYLFQSQIKETLGDKYNPMDNAEMIMEQLLGESNGNNRKG
jgi:transcriptional regulator with XRE-family HTH domain